MTQFTTEQIQKIELLTGFAVVDIQVRNRLSADYPDIVVTRTLEIFDELVNIDNLLKESLDTSFVRESRGSKLSYSQHVAHLKSEATRLLNELVQMLDISIRFNKYKPRSRKPLNYW